LKKTTIKDIALQLNVSISTVSRALNNHPDISPHLTEKIKETAKLLHYRPSTAALQLKRGTNKTIALILPEISSFFYPSVIHGIDTILHQQGYNLMILPSNDRLDREIENIDIAYDQDVAGAFISLSKETINLDHLKRFDDANIPVILLDKIKENAPYSSITIDDFKVSYQMVQHLFKTGSNRIAGIFGKASLTISHLRYKGFAQALRDLDLPLDDEFVFFVNNSEEAKSAAHKIVEKVKPNGLYLMTDEIMIGVMPALAGLHVKVPEDIAIISISDGSLAHFMIPRISHMLHNGFELGYLGAQKLVQYINAIQHNLPLVTPEMLVMNTNIVLLDSTKG